MGTDAAWIHASWGGPLGLAASGHAWAAVDRGRQSLAIARTNFRGTRYEDVAVFTAPDHRRHRLALACVRALTADITVRGHSPNWKCSTLNSTHASTAFHRWPDASWGTCSSVTRPSRR
ncbi:GNAT family N-acetyltransferase [Streptomyces sp. NPDC088358]|uniref:GNAT family N-acetyltransferase n=1 Tax=Streptomyces sp. NPDC088358 TaxID=3365857 RepID=UPI00380785CD